MLQACTVQVPAAKHEQPFTYADLAAANKLPYDAAPQIYKIDDNCFVSLENYRDCNYGEDFYNDTRKGIRSALGRAKVGNYQGRIVNADTTGKNIVIPSASPPRFACSDRGCGMGLLYSTDSGRRFSGITYNQHSFNPFEDSKRYAVTVTSDAYYVEERHQRYTLTEKVPLVEGYSYGQGPFPGGRKIEYGVAPPEGLRSPSGEDRITCNASVRPTNPDAPLN